MAGFHALPFSDRSRKEQLSKKFKVSGIPTLVLLDAKTGAVITAEGRGAVMDAAAYPWVPPTLDEALKARVEWTNIAC